MRTNKPLPQRYLDRKTRRIRAEAGSAPPSAWTDFNFLLSFGVTLAIMLFLSVKAGSFLGEKLNCGPWAIVALGALSIVGTLHVMVREALGRGKNTKGGTS